MAEDTDRAAEIEKRLAITGETPWVVSGGSPTRVCVGGLDGFGVFETTRQSVFQASANAQFAAHAHQDVRWLLDERKQLVDAIEWALRWLKEDREGTAREMLSAALGRDVS